MRNFRRDALSAAKAGLVFPAGEFSWSPARHKLFHRCRFAYFLHYYFTGGGWDPYADELIRAAYRAKKRISPLRWEEQLLQKILEQIFTAVRCLPREKRMVFFREHAKLLLDEGLRKTEELLSGEETDPSGERPDPGDLTVSDTLARMHFTCHDMLEQLAASDAFRILLALQGPLSPALPHFRKVFPMNGVSVWQDPGFIWREGDTLCALSLSCRGAGKEVSSLRADVFAFSVRKQSRKVLQIIRHPGDTDDPAPVEGDARRGEETIRASMDEMLEMIPDNEADIRDFPAEADGDASACVTCRYASVCPQIRSRFAL